MSGDSLRGRLLVATPLLEDPNFSRAVVLVLEHTAADGALGIVLNRPSETKVAEHFAEWVARVVRPPVLFVGGPVAPGAVIALAEGGPDAEEMPGWTRVLGALGSLDLARDPDDVQPHVAALRIFVGYAGWAARQLEDELAQQAWFVVDAEPGDVFTDGPDDLWRSVLRRQRGGLAVFAAFPDDPTSN